MPSPDDRRPSVFRLLVVPGVTAGRWSRVWAERLPGVELRLVHAEVAAQTAVLAEARADAGLVRLPIGRDTIDAIPLYTEATVVVVPRDHVITAADDVTAGDLVGETLLVPRDDVLAWTDPPVPTAVDRPATTAFAVELVAAGVGVLVVPQSLARLHHRRDVRYRVVTDAPTSSVALAWVRDSHTDLVEEMIGIVRGRTANSTRGREQTSPAPAVRTPAPAGGVKPRRDTPSGRSGTRNATAGVRHGTASARKRRRR